MTALLDQRHMTGPTILETEAQVRDFWAKKAREEGFRMRHIEGDDGRELRNAGRSVKAYVSDGRWVADCLTCHGGIAAGPSFAEGICLGCGTVYGLEHPSPEDVQSATEILALRPPQNRNWRPSIETVDHLRQENEMHGYLTDAEKARGEIEIVAAKTALKPSTVERIIRAQEELGLR